MMVEVCYSCNQPVADHAETCPWRGIMFPTQPDPPEPHFQPVLPDEPRRGMWLHGEARDIEDRPW